MAAVGLPEHFPAGRNHADGCRNGCGPVVAKPVDVWYAVTPKRRFDASAGKGLPYRHMLTAIKLICVIVAAILLGSVFRRQAQKTVAEEQPLHRVYFSVPGLLVLLVLLLPVVVWVIRNYF